MEGKTEIIDPIDSTKVFRLDRKNDFECKYNRLPIEKFEEAYYDQTNSVGLIGVYILPSQNIVSFTTDPSEDMLTKILTTHKKLIQEIKLSPCEKYLAVVQKKYVSVLSVEGLLKGVSKEVDYLEDEKGMRSAQFIQLPDSETKVVGLTQDDDIIVTSPQMTEFATPDVKNIITMNVSLDQKHILAIDAQDNLIIIDSESLDVVKKEYISFGEYKEYFFTGLQQIKPDVWVFMAVYEEQGINPNEYMRAIFLVQGDIINESITSLSVAEHQYAFLELTISMKELEIPDLKVTYLKERDMIFLGNSEGSEIKILFNESPKPSNNIFDYRMIEPNEDTTLAVQKHHTSNVAEVKLRGFAILTTKVFPNDDYLTRKNDDEVKIPYPPSIFVLTSSGEICLYHILDNRKEYYEKRILTEPVKFNTVKRQSAADTANPQAEAQKPSTQPVTQPSTQSGLFQDNKPKQEETKINEADNLPDLSLKQTPKTSTEQKSSGLFTDGSKPSITNPTQNNSLTLGGDKKITQPGGSDATAQKPPIGNPLQPTANNQQQQPIVKPNKPIQSADDSIIQIPEQEHNLSELELQQKRFKLFKKAETVKEYYDVMIQAMKDEILPKILKHTTQMRKQAYNYQNSVDVWRKELKKAKIQAFQQNRVTSALDKFLDQLYRDQDSLTEIIVHNKVEGVALQRYENAQLTALTQRCQETINRAHHDYGSLDRFLNLLNTIKEKVDSLQDSQRRTSLVKHLPPQRLSTQILRQKFQFTEQDLIEDANNPIYEDDGDIDLNFAPMSSSLQKGNFSRRRNQKSRSIVSFQSRGQSPMASRKQTFIAPTTSQSEDSSESHQIVKKELTGKFNEMIDAFKRRCQNLNNHIKKYEKESFGESEQEVQKRLKEEQQKTNKITFDDNFDSSDEEEDDFKVKPNDILRELIDKRNSKERYTDPHGFDHILNIAKSNKSKIKEIPQELPQRGEKYKGNSLYKIFNIQHMELPAVDFEQQEKKVPNNNALPVQGNPQAAIMSQKSPNSLGINKQNAQGKANPTGMVSPNPMAAQNKGIMSQNPIQNNPKSPQPGQPNSIAKPEALNRKPILQEEAKSETIVTLPKSATSFGDSIKNKTAANNNIGSGLFGSAPSGTQPENNKMKTIISFGGSTNPQQGTEEEKKSSEPSTTQTRPPAEKTQVSQTQQTGQTSSLKNKVKMSQNAQEDDPFGDELSSPKGSEGSETDKALFDPPQMSKAQPQSKPQQTSGTGTAPNTTATTSKDQAASLFGPNKGISDFNPFGAKNTTPQSSLQKTTTTSSESSSSISGGMLKKKEPKIPTQTRPEESKTTTTNTTVTNKTEVADSTQIAVPKPKTPTVAPQSGDPTKQQVPEGRQIKKIVGMNSGQTTPSKDGPAVTSTPAVGTTSSKPEESKTSDAKATNPESSQEASSKPKGPPFGNMKIGDNLFKTMPSPQMPPSGTQKPKTSESANQLDDKISNVVDKAARGEADKQVIFANKVDTPDDKKGKEESYDFDKALDLTIKKPAGRSRAHGLDLSSNIDSDLGGLGLGGDKSSLTSKDPVTSGIGSSSMKSPDAGGSTGSMQAPPTALKNPSFGLNSNKVNDFLSGTTNKNQLLSSSTNSQQQNLQTGQNRFMPTSNPPNTSASMMPKSDFPTGPQNPPSATSGNYQFNASESTSFGQTNSFGFGGPKKTSSNPISQPTKLFGQPAAGAGAGDGKKEASSSGMLFSSHTSDKSTGFGTSSGSSAFSGFNSKTSGGFMGARK